MVLDRTPSGNVGVSIVVRKEDISSGAWELEQFPDPPYDMYALTRLSGQLRYRLSDVSLAPGIEEDGRPVVDGTATPCWKPFTSWSIWI